MALAATGLARSSNPGRILRTVVAQMARKGVCVCLEFCPKKPPSGRPEGRVNKYKGRGSPCAYHGHG